MWMIWIAVTSVSLLIFGGTYAVYVAKKPLPPGRTWVEVVIGDSITALGMSFVLMFLVREFAPDAPWFLAPLAAFVPFWCLGLTGLPMIVGQLIKNYILEQTGGDMAMALIESMSVKQLAEFGRKDDDSEERVACGAHQGTGENG